MDFQISKIIRVLAFSFLIFLLLASVGSSSAQAGDPYGLLDVVNQLRAANRLESYPVNLALELTATATPGPSLEPIFGVQTVTPAADGSITHTVQAGQSLNLIATAYGITLDEIKALNNLTSELIQPGDQLIISTASPATATLEASKTPTRPPATSTRRPTRTPTIQPPASPTLEESFLPSATPTGDPIMTGDIIGNVLLIAIVLLVVAGVVMVVIGTALKRSS